MFPQPMSRSEFYPDDSRRDLTHTLEQHLAAGFPPDLALDLALNELVARAAAATHATAAALALVRGDEMVCRAATGHLAPDLGIPLNTRDGLSGACLETGQPQLSVDTEFDPRVDPAISRRLGIRSILIVPVFDAGNAQLTGILEIFSTSPAAFSSSDLKLLEGYAEQCARVRQAAIERSQRQPTAVVRPEKVQRETLQPKMVQPETLQPEIFPSELVPSESIPLDFIAASPLPARRPPYEVWTLVLGSLTILATITVSFLIGSRIGWLHPTRTSSSSQIAQPASCAGTPAPGCPAEPSPAATAATRRANSSPSEKPPQKSSTQSPRTPVPSGDGLVVYEKGKVVFRMKPAPTSPGQAERHQPNPAPTNPASDAIVEASSITKLAPIQSVWLAPAQAETRLLNRTEPQYPPEAVAAHRSGTVILEVQVAEDGSVSSIRTLSGDPILAAAATEAVRNWRYRPYRQNDHPARFQTDVTLAFALPN